MPLQYAFRERFGIPPKSYLLALRLNGVHRDLKNADPVSTKITDVAIRWGFWHMSQFEVDRHTMRNIRKAGWCVQVEEHLSLDIVRWIEAVP